MTWKGWDFLRHSTYGKINHFHHKKQQKPTVADPQSRSVPCRLLCNRLEVLIHFTLLRVMCGAGSKREKTVGKSVTAGKSCRQMVSWSVSKGKLSRGLHCILCFFIECWPGCNFYTIYIVSSCWSGESVSKALRVSLLLYGSFLSGSFY